MRKVLSIALCYILLACTTISLSGCNETPTEIVQNTANGLQLAKTYVASAKGLLPQISTINPELSTVVLQFINFVDPNIDTALTLCNNYLKLPAGDTYQNILNAVDALAASIDKNVLAAAHVTNTQSQAAALAVMTVASVGLHAVLGLLKQHATKAQVTAMPKIADKVEFDQIKQYIDREYVRQQLASHNYNADQVFEAAGL